MIKSHNVHLFYIPNESPWPVYFSGRAFNLFCILLLWTEKKVGICSLCLYFIIICIIIALWSSDIYCEWLYWGASSTEIDKRMKVSIIWFISREVIFFFSFFFAYLALSGCTELATGSVWPPCSILAINSSSVPLLSTIVLLRRGIALTWCHHSITKGNRAEVLKSLCITILLATGFTLLQILEYWERRFSLNDSFYGSIFFLATGFHGAHVILGSTLLIICLLHFANMNSCRRGNHVLFELSAWYWHFVDVVWLFLFLIMYCNLI